MKLFEETNKHNLGNQIKGLFKLVTVTKGKLFVSYEN